MIDLEYAQSRWAWAAQPSPGTATVATSATTVDSADGWLRDAADDVRH